MSAFALLACQKHKWPLVLCLECLQHMVCPLCIAEDGDDGHSED